MEAASHDFGNGGLELSSSLEVKGTKSFEEKLAKALSHDSYRRRQYEMERIFEDRTAEEAPAHLDSILDLPEARRLVNLLRPFFEKWGELDGPLVYREALLLLVRNRP